MPSLPLLLPAPRSIELTGGSYALADRRLVVIDAAQPQAILFSALALLDAVHDAYGFDWQMGASTAVPAELVAVTLRLAPARLQHAQGYRLTISGDGVVAEAHDPAGVYYAVCTLRQLLQQSDASLPCLVIEDWPDFPARGVMLDISRDRVPTMETLFGLVDMLSSWKVNQLQLYTEHSFAYRNHPEAWAMASPMTGDEILQLDAYCRERYVELVPNQNSFGHMERWFLHPQYAALSEGVEPNMTLCATDPGSLSFVAGLFDELLPHFSSRLFNVGCDETQVGQGRSKAESERLGAGRVYLNFLLSIYREVTKRGFTMMFWGDIIMKHPELIPELPKDMIALEWGYSANHPFAEHGAQFAASGIPFYVCSGTSTWGTLSGHSDKALANNLNAAENGLKNGAIGFLITDWGDRGHSQMLPISFLPFAAGAAYSWCVATNRDLNLAEATGYFGFEDVSGRMGQIAYDLGNVHRRVSEPNRGSNRPVTIIQTPLVDIPARFPDLTPAKLTRVLALIDKAMRGLDDVYMTRPDAELIKDEFRLTARLLRHACRRALLALGEGDASLMRRELDLDMLAAIQEYARLWLARDRAGGLADSLRRLEKARLDYQWYPLDNYPC